MDFRSLHCAVLWERLRCILAQYVSCKHYRCVSTNSMQRLVRDMPHLSLLSLIQDLPMDDITTNFRTHAESIYQRNATTTRPKLPVITFGMTIQSGDDNFLPDENAFMPVKHPELALEGLNPIIAVPVPHRALKYILPYSCKRVTNALVCTYASKSLIPTIVG